MGFLFVARKKLSSPGISNCRFHSHQSHVVFMEKESCCLDFFNYSVKILKKSVDVKFDRINLDFVMSGKAEDFCVKI